MTVNQQVNIAFNVQVNNPQFIDQLNQQVNNLNNTVVQTGGAFNQSRRAGQRLQEQNDLLGKSYRTLAASAKAFVTFEVSRFLSGLARDAFAAQDGLERLEDQLVALRGNAELGAAEFERLQRVAADLPATFQQVALGATKLDLLGLDASQQSLRTFLDLAAGLGKPVEQIVEAFADAGAGFEFERLKELGIVARQETDKVIISFRGMEAEVAKTEEAVVEGLLNIGRVNFSGAAELQADNFTTQFGILREQLSLLVRDFSDASGLADGVTGGIADLNTNIRILRGVDGVDDLRAQLENAREELERMEGIAEVLSFDKIFLPGIVRETREQVQALETRLVNLNVIANEIDLSNALAIGGDGETTEQQTDKQLKAYETFVSGLERQVARLKDQSNEAALLRLVPTLTDEQREAAESLIGTINSLERQNELRKEAAELTRTLANNAQQAKMEYDDALASIASAVDSGILSQALADTLDENALEQFKEKILDFIGPEVIIDGTEAARVAAEQQMERINEAFRLGTVGQAAIQEFQIQQQREHLDRINELIADQAAGNDPFIQFEQQLLEGRRAFLEQTGGVTDELVQKFAEYRAQLQEGFLDDFTIDIDTSGTVTETIALFNAELEKLTETTNLFTSQQITDEQIEQYEKLAAALGLTGVDGADGIGTARANINALAELNQQLLDVGAQSNEDFLANEAELQRRRVQLWVDSTQQITDAFLSGTLSMSDIADASTREIVQGFLGAAEQITQGWEGQSRTIFELNKALNIGMAVNNFWTGITAAWAQGGPLGFLQGILATGQLINAINEIRNNEFGDTSSPSASGGPSASSGISQQTNNFAGGGAAGANITVNVQGSVIDEGGLQQAIVSGIREATNNRQVRLGNSSFNIRR